LEVLSQNFSRTASYQPFLTSCAAHRFHVMLAPHPVTPVTNHRESAKAAWTNWEAFTVEAGHVAGGECFSELSDNLGWSTAIGKIPGRKAGVMIVNIP
jgi:hypothetical protein